MEWYEIILFAFVILFSVVLGYILASLNSDD